MSAVKNVDVSVSVACLCFHNLCVSVSVTCLQTMCRQSMSVDECVCVRLALVENKPVMENCPSGARELFSSKLNSKFL